MSRTIKDMPYEVRMCDYYGRKTPKAYRNSDYVRYNDDVYVDWMDEWKLEAGLTEVDCEAFWNIYWFSTNGVVGRCARIANRKYRAENKQAMRNGDFETRVLKRTARWDAS